jgi:hypothetical protein
MAILHTFNSLDRVSSNSSVCTAILQNMMITSAFVGKKQKIIYLTRLVKFDMFLVKDSEDRIHPV